MAAVAGFNSSEAHHIFLSTFLGTLGTPRLAVSHHLLQGNVSALWTVVETCALLADMPYTPLGHDFFWSRDQILFIFGSPRGWYGPWPLAGI